MKSNEFVTADHHFGHRGILRKGGRPWTDIDEMNEDLIRRWNAKVPARGAIVYHLGDFSWMNRKRTEEVLWQLNGTIRLVKGNHDHTIKGELEKEFEWVKDSYHSKTEKGISVHMYHWACQTWNKIHYGGWMLHGHSHGSLKTPMWMRRLDVGIDTHPNFEPWSYEEIEHLMKDRSFKPQDHHEETS